MNSLGGLVCVPAGGKGFGGGFGGNLSGESRVGKRKEAGAAGCSLFFL